MGAKASAYERELKGILSADEAALRRAARGLDGEAAGAYLKSAARPFLVVRGAGSLGVDLVALRGEVSFPIEVKSASPAAIRFSDESGRNMDQARALRAECARAGVMPLYAYRRKNLRGEDPWRVYTLPADDGDPDLSGRLAILQGRVPCIARTPGGSYVMRWDDGLPLHRFLQYVSHVTS